MKITLCTTAHPIRCVRVRFTCAIQVIMFVFGILLLAKYTKYTSKNIGFNRQEVSSETTEKGYTSSEPLLSASSSSRKTVNTTTTEDSERPETNSTAQQLLASSGTDERGLTTSDEGETRHSTPSESNDWDLGKTLDAAKQVRHRTTGFDSVRRNSHDESAVDTSEITAGHDEETSEGANISEESQPDSHELQQVDRQYDDKSNGHLESEEESEKQPDASTSQTALQRNTETIRNASVPSTINDDLVSQTELQKTSVKAAVIDFTFTSSKTNERDSIPANNDTVTPVSDTTLKHSPITAAAAAAADDTTSIYNKSTTSIPTNARTILTSKLTAPAPTASFRSETAKTSCGNNDEHLKMINYDVDATKKSFQASAPEFAQLWDQLKPATTDSQRETVNLILTEFVKACALYKITNYFIFSGTLLGSYRHHGLQPWDDDVDILMKYSDGTHIYRSLKAYVAESDFVVYFLYGRLKIFHRKLSVRILGFEHRWPFVDISFYHDNETHIWEEYGDGRLYHVVPKTLIFPLHPRPFEGVWMNSPRDAYAVLKMLFGSDNCITLTWLHRTELAPPLLPAQFDCEITASVYPFVHRKPIQGCMEESLQINGTVVQALLIEEPTYAVTEPYRLKLAQRPQQSLARRVRR